MAEDAISGFALSRILVATPKRMAPPLLALLESKREEEMETLEKRA